MKHTLALILFCVGIHITSAQTTYSTDIVGTWKLSKETLEAIANDDNYQQSQKDPLINADVKLKFEKDKTLIMYLGEFSISATYELNENILTMGIRKFVIIDMRRTQMELQEKGDTLKRKFTYIKVKDE